MQTIQTEYSFPGNLSVREICERDDNPLIYYGFPYDKKTHFCPFKNWDERFNAPLVKCGEDYFLANIDIGKKKETDLTLAPLNPAEILPEHEFNYSKDVILEMSISYEEGPLWYPVECNKCGYKDPNSPDAKELYRRVKQNSDNADLYLRGKFIPEEQVESWLEGKTTFK